MPRSAWPDNLTMAVIALSTVAYLAALPYPLGPLDEGLYLFEAKRILHGDVFYRDIFDIATPGSYYLMALMFALFGTTMTVARTAAALIHGLTAALVYAGGRRLGVDRPLSLAAAASQLAVCQAAWPYASPHWAGTLITTLLLVVLIGRPTLQRWRWYLLPGTLLGALALVQHQKALIIAFGVAAVLAADFVIDLRFGRSTRVADMLRGVFAVAAGALLVALPALALLVSQAGVEPVYRSLVEFPLFNYHNAGNEIVWGDINPVTSPYARRTFPHLLMWLPATALPALPLAATLWTRRANLERLRALCLLLGFGAFSIASIAYHPDFIHLAFVAQPFFLLIALQAAWLLEALPRAERLAPPAGALASLIVLAVFGWQLGSTLVLSRRNFTVVADTAFGRVHFRRPSDFQPIEALRRRLDRADDRRMFIYPGPPSLYLLTGAENPTRYQFLAMPYHDRDQVDEVLGDLERKRVPFFVTPGVATPQDPVFAYVLEKYRQTDTFGGLRLYERNDR